MIGEKGFPSIIASNGGRMLSYLNRKYVKHYQLPVNSTSASILENTQVIYSLRNEKGYDELKNRLHLSNHDLNQLKSIRNHLTGERKYTEIFIKIGKQSNIYRLEVPPEVYAAYLTDGKESEAIMKLYQKSNSMESAIREFIDIQHRSYEND